MPVACGMENGNSSVTEFSGFLLASQGSVTYLASSYIKHECLKKEIFQHISIFGFSIFDPILKSSY